MDKLTPREESIDRRFPFDACGIAISETRELRERQLRTNM
jgi:hypothetical protein